MKGLAEDLLKFVTIPLALLGGVATAAKFLETRYDRSAAVALAWILVPIGVVMLIGAALALLPLWRKTDPTVSDQPATLAALKVTTYRLVGVSLLTGAVAVAVSLYLVPKVLAIPTPVPTTSPTSATPPPPTATPPATPLRTLVPTPTADLPTPEPPDQPCLTDSLAPTWRFYSSTRQSPKINTDVGCLDLSEWGLYPRVQSTPPHNTILHVDVSTNTSRWAAVRYIPLKNDHIQIQITITSIKVERKDGLLSCPTGDPCDMDLLVGIGSYINAQRNQEPVGRFLTFRVFDPEGPIRVCALSTIYDSCAAAVTAFDYPLASLPITEVVTIVITGTHAEFYLAGVLADQYEVPPGSKALWVGYSAYTQGGFANAALEADIEFVSPPLFLEPPTPTPLSSGP